MNKKKRKKLSQLTRDAAEFPDSYAKYFKQIKRLKSLQKAEAYLGPNRTSTMELFLEYTYRRTIFAIKASS